MKALVLHGNKDLRYQDFPEPEPMLGEVRLQVKSSGLCHTDFNEYLNGPLYVSTMPHHQDRAFDAACARTRVLRGSNRNR